MRISHSNAIVVMNREILQKTTSIKKKTQEVDATQQEEGSQHVRKKSNNGKGSGSSHNSKGYIQKLGPSRQNLPLKSPTPKIHF
jgi:hypothetical protein